MGLNDFYIVSLRKSPLNIINMVVIVVIVSRIQLFHGQVAAGGKKAESLKCFPHSNAYIIEF